MGQAGGSPRGYDETRGSGTENRSGSSSTVACGLPSPHYHDAQAHPGSPGIGSTVDGYQIPNFGNDPVQSHPFNPYSPSHSHQLNGYSSPLTSHTPPPAAGEDDLYSDNDDSHSQSLTITHRGQFRLGPQWAVPDREVAQDMAGCGSARAVVKSVQYLDEHGAHFTLTETIDDCDLSMSGGLSVNGVAPTPPSGLCARDGDGDGGNCASFFSCWDCTDATLPQPRPSNSNGSRMAAQPRSNDHHGCISGVPASSQPQGASYGLDAPENDYRQRDGRYHRGHGHYHDYEPIQNDGNRLCIIKEPPSRQIRRVKNFHRGSTYQMFEG